MERLLMFLTLTVIQLIFANDVDARFMRWIPNTDFDNPKNWKSGRAPCSNEHVRFPPSVSSVFVQRNNTVMEIVLPNDGEIVLGQDMTLSFSLSANLDTACQEKETVYNGSTPMAWFSPDNWCEMSDIDSEQCQPDKSPRLHMESIPCSYDDVVFPLVSRFVVDIASGAEIKVNSFHIGPTQYAHKELRQFLTTDVGRRQFVRQSPGAETKITVKGLGSCNDVTGCICDNEQIFDKVCEIMQPQCRQLVCQKALLPHGHCCHICGALMNLDVTTGFRRSSVDNLLKSLYQQPVTKRSTREEKVWWIISKIDTGIATSIQVVISDNGDGETAVKVAYKLKEEIQKDMKGRRRLGITHLEMQVTGTSPEAHGQTGDDASRTGTGLASVIVPILFVVLIVVIIIAICIVFKRTGRRIPFTNLDYPTFARWRSGSETSQRPGEMELRGVIYDNKMYEGSTSYPNLAFENLQMPQVFDPPQELRDRGAFENPLYGGEVGVQEVKGQSSEKRSESKPAGQPPFGDVSTEKSRPQKSLSSKFSGMFRSDPFGRRRFEDNVDDDDENANVKEKQPDVAETEERQNQTRSEASTGRQKSDERRNEPSDSQRKKKNLNVISRSGKHSRLEESDDSGDDIAERPPQKEDRQTSVSKEKGFSNPCYDNYPITESTAVTTKPIVEDYGSGFSNPVFSEPKQHLEGAEQGESNA